MNRNQCESQEVGSEDNEGWGGRQQRAADLVIMSQNFTTKCVTLCYTWSLQAKSCVQRSGYMNATSLSTKRSNSTNMQNSCV